MDFNEEFRLAEQFVNETNTSVFLTGKAGTGKTTFLRYIVGASAKETVVVAPTGVAAINASGSTIHSMFGLPLKGFIPVNDPVDHNIANNPASLARHFRFRQDKRKLLLEMELLIIDEISMVRADILDAVDYVLRFVRRNALPFGGVQILAIGDLFQLSPVVPQSEWPVLSTYYSKPYFFESVAWKKLGAVTLELQKVYRQKNETFLSVLNRIRTGTTDQDDLEILNQRVVSPARLDGQPDVIVLTTHNATANQINQKRLAQLEGNPFQFEADIKGDFSESSYPVDPSITLVEGAQVMFVRNDTENHLYFNGKIGRIEEIDSKKVKVRCKNEDLIQVEPIEWENFRYKLNDQGEIIQEKIGSFKQYPLRLAWAITVHKSQGLTFDHIALDLSRSFAPGQVYVALSRCRTMEGLYLHSPLKMRNILVDRTIIEFFDASGSGQDLESLLRTGRRRNLQNQLKKLFDFSPLQYLLSEWLNEVAEKDLEVGKKIQGVQLRNELKECNYIAGKFHSEIDFLLHQYFRTEEIQPVLVRLHKGVTYFATRLLKNVINPVTEYYDQIAYISGTIRHQRETLDFIQTLWIHLEKMTKARFLDHVIYQGEPMQRPDRLGQAVRRKKKGKKQRTQEITYELYQKGKTLSEIAAIRQLTEGTIQSHLLTLYKEDKVPITFLIDKERLARILGHLDDITEEVTLSKLKDQVPFTSSFAEIRIAKAYYLKEN